MSFIHRSNETRIYKNYSGKIDRSYNHFHNILGTFDVLANFPFTTSEMTDDYYL